MPSLGFDPIHIFDDGTRWLIVEIISAVSLIGFVLWAADQLFAPISVMKYGIVGFFGKRGSGKSFAAVTYARRWRNFNPNKPVWTNLEKLNLPGYNGPCTCACEWRSIYNEDTKKHEDVYIATKRCKAVHLCDERASVSFQRIMTGRDGLVLIDEAGVFVGSLNFADKGNRQFARWLVATRHYKIMLLLTAHTPGTVNNRLRDVIDEFIHMEPFTTLKIFKATVYESAATFMRPKMHSHTVFIPMWWTTSRSYNTDSLLVKAEKAGVSVIGDDFDLPGLGEAIQARNSGNTIFPLGAQTTTNGGFINSDGVTNALPTGNLPIAGTRTDQPNQPGYPNSTTIGSSGASASNNVPSSTGNTNGSVGIDAAILGSLISRTAETWNGRTTKPRVAIRRKSN